MPLSASTASAWIAGVGTEYALIGGWSVKSEWLYADFGTFRAFDSVTQATPIGGGPAGFGGCGVPGFAANCSNRDVRLHEFIWRVGMNYRFDWASYR